MTTYADIRAALDQAEAAGLPVPDVDLYWHQATSEVARAVVAAYPDHTWSAHAAGATEWVASRSGHVDLTAYLPAVVPELSASTRAEAVLQAAREQVSA